MRMTDKEGNRLYFYEGGVELHLKGQSYRRKIFNVIGGQIIKQVMKGNIMRNGNMLGFNYKALNVLRDRFKKKFIYVVIGKKKFKVPISEIIDNSEFLHFKTEGFELQIFYPIKKMEDKWKYKSK